MLSGIAPDVQLWLDPRRIVSVGAFTNVIPASAAASTNNGEPHCGQKRRITGKVDVPEVAYALGSPRTSSDSEGTATLTEYPPLPDFWQSRQWQNAVRAGCADDVYVYDRATKAAASQSRHSNLRCGVVVFTLGNDPVAGAKRYGVH
jgi:hypothetical protein